MKLFLTSYRIPAPEALFKLIGKEPVEVSIAIIPNAGDYYAERPRQIKFQDTVDYFKELGVVNSKIVDLQKYYSGTELKKELDSVDLIWASGGNTFMLRQQMKRSGFDKVIVELLANGVTYGGESAGALVAGNSLKGVEHADDARFVETEIWDGLKLIDHFVLPHVGSPLFAGSIDKTRADHADDPTMIELTDAQVLVVNEKKTEILTGDSL